MDHAAAAFSILCCALVLALLLAAYQSACARTHRGYYDRANQGWAECIQLVEEACREGRLRDAEIAKLKANLENAMEMHDRQKERADSLYKDWTEATARLRKLTANITLARAALADSDADTDASPVDSAAAA